MIIHVLRGGLSLCGFSTEVPAKWPGEDRWVSIDDAENFGAVSCPGCLRRLRELVRPRKESI